MHGFDTSYLAISSHLYRLLEVRAHGLTPALKKVPSSISSQYIKAREHSV